MENSELKKIDIKNGTCDDDHRPTHTHTHVDCP